MSWLRLDDGFTRHPKFDGWDAWEKWTWLEIMAYCAQFKTGGRIPNTPDLLPAARRRRYVGGRRTEDQTCIQVISKAIASGLADTLPGDDHAWVHDWAKYNPKDPAKAARQAKWRAKRDGLVDDDVDDDVDGGNRLPPARASARGPSRPSKFTTPTAVVKDDGLLLLDAELTTALERLGFDKGQVARSLTLDRELVTGWIAASKSPTVRNQGAYLWHGLTSGAPPPPAEGANVDIYKACRNYVTGVGWDPEVDAVEVVAEELERKERKARLELAPAERDELLALATTRIAEAQAAGAQWEGEEP